MSVHVVRMSVWVWAIGMNRDQDGRYVWLDAFKRRVCLIWS